MAAAGTVFTVVGVTAAVAVTAVEVTAAMAAAVAGTEAAGTAAAAAAADTYSLAIPGCPLLGTQISPTTPPPERWCGGTSHARMLTHGRTHVHTRARACMHAHARTHAHAHARTHAR